VCKFSKLDSLAIKKIVVKFVDQLKVSLGSKNIRLNLSEAVIEHLADKGYDSKMGARPLGRKIDELIRVPLSKKILFERLSDCDVQVDMDQDQLVFVPSAGVVVPHVDNDGMIQV
jgi:ATP-dependent Clp protease ATP-binding subunit ClpA